jgi:hypothetical protein
MTLVTHNTADFLPIPGLRLVDWLSGLEALGRWTALDRSDTIKHGRGPTEGLAEQGASIAISRQRVLMIRSRCNQLNT